MIKQCILTENAPMKHKFLCNSRAHLNSPIFSMTGVRYQAANELFNLMIDTGALYYSVITGRAVRNINVHVKFLCVFTQCPRSQINRIMKELADEVNCPLVCSTAGPFFNAYAVGDRARAFEIGLLQRLRELPEYCPTVPAADPPTSEANDGLMIPKHIEFPQHLLTPTEHLVPDPIDLLERAAKYLWAKGECLDHNQRKELEHCLLADFRPLLSRMEALVLRAIDFNDNRVRDPAFLRLFEDNRYESDD